MSVLFINKTRAQINKDLVQRVTKVFLKHYELSDKAVTVIFIADSEMQTINRTFRKRDKVTDVLSFAEMDSDFADQTSLGEIFIDYQQIKRQAKLYHNQLEYELVFILVHGLLHLLGYDDRTKAQSEIMKELGTKFILKYFKTIAKNKSQ